VGLKSLKSLNLTNVYPNNNNNNNKNNKKKNKNNKVKSKPLELRTRVKSTYHPRNRVSPAFDKRLPRIDFLKVSIIVIGSFSVWLDTNMAI
jgi:hypothetical protein